MKENEKYCGNCYSLEVKEGVKRIFGKDIEWLSCSKCGWNSKPMSEKKLKKLAIEILEELLRNSDDEMSSVYLMKKNKAMPEDYTRARNVLDEKLDKLKEELKKE